MEAGVGKWMVNIWRLIVSTTEGGQEANLFTVFATLWTVAHQAPLSMRFSSKNTGVGFHLLL